MTADPKPVLIVEDDADIQGVISKMLRDEGFLVKTANNGSTATYQIDNQEFVAIITDVKLPGMNGLQVVANARLAKRNAKTPVIVVSGYVTEEVRVRCRDMGVGALLSKPFDPGVILAKVKEFAAAEKAASAAAAKAAPAKAPEAARSPYDVKVINAILSAINEVMTFYLGSGLEVKKPFIKTAKQPVNFATAVISLTGAGIQGALSISFNKDFLEALHAKVYEGFSTPRTDDALADLSGETCNQVCGKVKINFAKIGVKILIGLPEVIVGERHTVSHKTSNPVLCVPLAHTGRTCVVEFCFTRSMVEELSDGKAPDKVEEAPAASVMFFDD